MRTIVYLGDDPETNPHLLYDADVIGLPITIEYTLRCAWNTVKPGTFADTYQFSMQDDPWFKWVMESKANYIELWNYGLDIMDEHFHRFGSRQPSPYRHGSTAQMERLGVIPELPDVPATPYPTSIDDARAAYANEKIVAGPFVKWADYTHREKPEWLK